MKKEISCGAIIIKDKKVLIVRSKKDHYGFPKGHMEKGETEKETAIRETKEETNVDIEINESKKYTIYYASGENITKKVTYFLAKPKEPINLIKEEKEIKELFWQDIDKVEDLLTRENIKKIWRRVLSEI